MTDLSDFKRNVHEPILAELAAARRVLREAQEEREEWARNASEWKRHAERLQREIIDDEEYRAFIRLLLVEAREGLEDGTLEGMRDSLLAIRDHILPPEETRNLYALEAEQKAIAAGEKPYYDNLNEVGKLIEPPGSQEGEVSPVEAAVNEAQEPNG